LAALELFERAINGKDIATGKEKLHPSYITKGTPKSEYREGNSTLVFEVLPTNSTYNTTTNRPDIMEAKKRMELKRGILSPGKRVKL
jgi:hypothetical protein